METLLNAVSLDTLLVIAAYAALGAAYLVVVPLFLLLWMNKRWTVTWANLNVWAFTGWCFLFFPGMIVFAPFLNFRLSGQGEV